MDTFNPSIRHLASSKQNNKGNEDKLCQINMGKID